MARLRSVVALFAVAAAIRFVMTPVSAMAEDFRIATKIFVGKEVEPVSETTTLFMGGVVYDFLDEAGQTAVFRKPGGGKSGRFILLNSDLKIRTELTTVQLDGAMVKLRKWAGQQKDPFLQFAANPDFEVTFSRDDGKLVLASHLENYTVTTTPAEHPEAIAEYREFLDWYAQLNTLLTGGPPPEPRLRLNEALGRHKAVPLTVTLTRTGEKEPLRAEHEFTWRLSQNDVKRIDDVRAALASYRPVSNEEFLRSTEPMKDK